MFKTWGPGETLNNGTHEVDVCRWALGVDFPHRITATGGRYQFKDDWQFYDTLMTSFDYDDKMISWEGKCCDGMKYYNHDSAWNIVETTSTMLIDRNVYATCNLMSSKMYELN